MEWEYNKDKLRVEDLSINMLHSYMYKIVVHVNMSEEM